MEFEALHFCRPDDQTLLTEHFNSGAWSLHLKTRNAVFSFSEYELAGLDREDEPRSPWNGASPAEILARGTDVLGCGLLEKGEPSYSEVRRLLPPVTRGAYCFLGGAASWSGVTVNTRGQIFPQDSTPQDCGTLRQPPPIFSPVLVDGELGECPARQFLLDGRYPLLFSVHRSGEQILELLYFVEPGDPDRDPVVWIRAKRYQISAPQAYVVEYRLAARSRIAGRHISGETFLAALTDTLVYWASFARAGASFSLPETSLERVAEGAMMACAVTFTADHAHYGHLYYGLELHDNFPPNYIWSLEACCLTGRFSWARRIWQHLLLYVLNDCGRFVYRQGDRELFGASAEEYGQLLFLACRYAKPLMASAWPDEYWQKLYGIGELLLSHCTVCSEFGGRRFIRMCAEADTNTRVHVYLNNNLWGIRGFEALVNLIQRYAKPYQTEIFARTATVLRSNLHALAAEYAVDTPYGPLVPFRFGYAAVPYTLSTCCDASAPLTPIQLRAYLVRSDERSQGGPQDLTENTYANYRYYPEALSAMLLEPRQAQAIVAAREALGGECLGMTRFFGWLDDWPVVHYARYLLETGHVEKYLLLLYAHTAHHGDPDRMCYYEQVSVDGAVIAPDCIPSLLTTPILTAWMFAYETVADCRLILLKAIPKAWFSQAFSARGVGFSGGSCDFVYAQGKLEISFSAPLECEAELVWRSRSTLCTKDLAQGAEWVDRIQANRLILKKGLSHAVFELR